MNPLRALLRRLVFERERADNMRSPGEIVVLSLGPVVVCVNTADGGSAIAGITVGRLYAQWGWENDDGAPRDAHFDLEVDPRTEGLR